MAGPGTLKVGFGLLQATAFRGVKNLLDNLSIFEK
jgi:hypothetical protein